MWPCVTSSSYTDTTGVHSVSWGTLDRGWGLALLLRSTAGLSSWLNPKGYSWTSHEASWILITGISGGLICHPPDLSGHDWAWTRHTVYCCCFFFNVFIILLGIIPNGLWRKLIHLVWWVFQKLLMKICSPINNKTSAELSYTGQRGWHQKQHAT